MRMSADVVAPLPYKPKSYETIRSQYAAENRLSTHRVILRSELDHDESVKAEKVMERGDPSLTLAC